MKAEYREEIKKVEKEFKETWGTLLHEILSEPKFNDIRSSMKWLEKVLQTNVPHGKHKRAYLHILLYRKLKPVRTEEEDFLNYACGWVVETFGAAKNMVDDFMEKRETRHGRLCWYRNLEVGKSVINDRFLLESFALSILFKYFGRHNYLVKLIQLFRENILKGGFGDSLNLRVVNEDGPLDFSKFTEDNYTSMVKYKESYTNYYEPIASAILRAGINDQSTLKAIENVALKLGELFQLREDFLDCFGDPVVMGKRGSDIGEGKLTWLIVKALELGSDSQKELLRKHYGNPTVIAVYEVQSVYEDLGLQQLVYKREDELRQEALVEIKAIPRAVPQEPFFTMLDTLCKREQ